MKLRLRVVPMLVVLAELVGAMPSFATPPDPPTRVFLARHAESMSIPGNRDAPLTAAGMRRAAALGQVLRSADVAQVFASQFLRSHATAAQCSSCTCTTAGPRIRRACNGQRCPIRRACASGFPAPDAQLTRVLESADAQPRG